MPADPTPSPTLASPPTHPAAGELLGIHHVTALAKDPRANLGFYTRVLGLRLVKRTVNFDDPGSYHFYFGDRVGRPGTLMTFFPHPQAARGSRGAGEVETTVFAVPDGSLGWWAQRLQANGVEARVERHAGEDRLVFSDHDGTGLALVERGGDAGTEPPEGADVPPEHAVRGIDGVVIAARDLEPTGSFLTGVLGMTELPGETPRFRIGGTGGIGRHVEVRIDPSLPRPRLGAGSVHHVAFRVRDEAAQARVNAAVAKQYDTTFDVRDRTYFRSIYFREPGGTIFEVATDGPGFLIDETEPALGEALRLPPQYEPLRERIEAALPPLDRATAWEEGR